MALTILLDAPVTCHVHSPANIILQSSVVDIGHKVIVSISPGGNKWAFNTDSYGRIYFDLSKFIKFQFNEWENNLIYNNSADVTVLSYMCQDIAVTMQDVDDVSPAPMGTYTFVYGGISFEKYIHPGWFDTVYNAAAPIYPFMTWRNRSLKKYTTKTALEFLTFYFPYMPSVQACIHAWGFNDVTIYHGPMPLFDAVSGPYTRQLMRFGVGFGHVDYSYCFDINLCKRFRIYLKETTGVQISEDRWYYLDQREHKKSHQFLYLNSLGGIDTLFINNDIQMKARATRTVVSRNYIGAPYMIPQGSKVSKNNKIENSFVVKYYPDSNYEKLLLQDMVVSRRIWKYEDGILKPLFITSGDIDFGTDNEPIRPVEFEYEFAFDNTQVTPGNTW